MINKGRPLPKNIVARPRLFNRLDLLLKTSSIWLSANAGSGKTSLISSYNLEEWGRLAEVLIDHAPELLQQGRHHTLRGPLYAGRRWQNVGIRSCVTSLKVQAL